jgi:signal transduction histidine kinase
MTLPELGDWCVIDIARDGVLRRAKVGYALPTFATLAEDVMHMNGCDAELRQLVSRGPFLASNYQEERVPEGTLRELLERLNARSLMVVPLHVHGELAAVATFVASGDRGRTVGNDLVEREHYCDEELILAQEIVGRAAQIVESAQLQRKLRASEERLRLALTHAGISVFELDRALNLRWLHCPPVGLGAGVLVDDPELLSLARSAIDGRRGLTQEFRNGTNGTCRHFLVSVEPLYDAQELRCVIGAATEITETKRAQEELALELAFRERIMGVLGHDLRSPLSAVRALSQVMLRDDSTPADVREMVEQISRAAQRMSEMISTLLDFTASRFRGGLPITKEPSDLYEIVSAVIDELRAAHRGRLIGLDTHGDPRGHWDPARLAQVVSNLVANALAYGAVDQPVQVSIVGDIDVALSVSNRGPTIAPDLLTSIFEPFRRGPCVEQRGGLGLGLYIVDQIVRAHDGTITVESTSERGTVFTVRMSR